MYTSLFRKCDTYDWFCGPGSHLCSHIYAEHLQLFEWFLSIIQPHPTNNVSHPLNSDIFTPPKENGESHSEQFSWKQTTNVYFLASRVHSVWTWTFQSYRFEWFVESKHKKYSRSTPVTAVVWLWTSIINFGKIWKAKLLNTKTISVNCINKQVIKSGFMLD